MSSRVGSDTAVEYPEALETYADFVNAEGGMVGSYVDADGIYNAYVRVADGSFASLNLSTSVKLEYFFVHGINDARVIVARAKPVDAPPITYVGLFPEGLQVLKFPDSVSTEGYNINQDGSVVGHYDSADGRRHGFIARPVSDTAAPVEAVHGTFLSLDLPHAAQFEYFFLPGVNDAGRVVVRARLIGDIPRTAVGTLEHGLQSLEVPGSVSTDGWNINQDGSIVGNYKSKEVIFTECLQEVLKSEWRVPAAKFSIVTRPDPKTVKRFHNSYIPFPVKFGCPRIHAAAFKGEGFANNRHGLLMRAAVPSLFEVKPAGARDQRTRIA